MNLPRVAIALAFLLTTATAQAHQQSQSMLRLVVPAAPSPAQLRLDLALVDLEHAIGLDDNADAQISWGELREHEAQIRRYVESRMKISSRLEAGFADCPLRFASLRVDTHSDGTYAVLDYTADCANAAAITVNYALLFDLDSAHRSLISISHESGSQQTGVLSADSRELSLNTAEVNGWQWRESAQWISQGLWHIWIGFDHLLFLFTLVLPAVVRRDPESGWSTQPSLRAAVLDIARVVTAFTLAHSLTLALAALGLVRIEIRWVESAIALTVLLGALNILFPFVRERRWMLALVFGLIHGLGFAAALGDLGLGGRHLVGNLLLFNLGVELGQLAIVAAFVPATWLLRERHWYRAFAIPAAAVTTGLLAVWWLVQRLTG